MQFTESHRVMHVERAEAARALLDPEQLQFFEPFLDHSLTVSEAARICNCKPNSLLARVRRFVELGLLYIEREIPRLGRSIKVYRSTASVFFVPIGLHDVLDGHDEWFGQLTRQVESGLRYGYGHSKQLAGSRVYRNEQGVATVSFATDPDTDYDSLSQNEPALLTLSHDAVQLDFEDAKQLQRELHDLFQKYAQRTGSQKYLIWLNLVPIPKKNARLLKPDSTY